ncbi:hypothetical protein [Plesiocystis pacifica]|uniref:hypothetical protein n=1 Tax=Plesiocystis pacifica TaxID=191768 RepID=UPI0012F75161|nr:hypothetical protein [Plesiocystis pacifica]
MRTSSPLATGLASALGLSLALTCLLAPGVASAKRLTPEQAAEARSAVDTTDPDAMEEAAEELGDPELFLRAAEALRLEADTTRDLDLAIRALPLAQTANDIAAYLADERNYKNSDWRPVERDRAVGLVAESKESIQSIEALIAAIEEERRKAAEEEAARQAALAAAGEDEKKKRGPMKPGTGMIIGGSAALALGVGGVAIVGVGLAQGNAAQAEAESLDLPAEIDRLSELDAAGSRANNLALVGGIVGGVGLIAGATLVALGVKKRKQAGPDASASVQVGGYFSAQGGGLQLSGSF